MELSHIEIKKYFLENKEEGLNLQNKIFKNYQRNFIREFSLEDFLNWYFVKDQIYLKSSFIEIPFKLKRFFNNILTINNKLFVSAKLYYDTETNIPLYSISIDSDKIKHYLSKEDLFKEYDSLLKNFNNFSGFSSRKDYLCFEKNIYLPTKHDFCGNYLINNKEFCKFSISKLASNLDLWRIRLEGNDDYSLSKDFLSKESAFEEMKRLKSLKEITDSYLFSGKESENYYFSN